MIGGNKIVRAFFLYIFQSFGKDKYCIEYVNEIGKRVNRLADEIFHIRKFTKKCINTFLYRKTIPKMGVIKKRIEHGDRSAKNNRGYKRYQNSLSVCFKK
jgi:GTP-dependent phosphoenolpyruvate carboxykinase